MGTWSTAFHPYHVAQMTLTFMLDNFKTTMAKFIVVSVYQFTSYKLQNSNQTEWFMKGLK